MAGVEHDNSQTGEHEASGSNDAASDAEDGSEKLEKAEFDGADTDEDIANEDEADEDEADEDKADEEEDNANDRVDEDEANDDGEPDKDALESDTLEEDELDESGGETDDNFIPREYSPILFLRSALIRLEQRSLCKPCEPKNLLIRPMHG